MTLAIINTHSSNHGRLKMKTTFMTWITLDNVKELAPEGVYLATYDQDVKVKAGVTCNIKHAPNTVGLQIHCYGSVGSQIHDGKGNQYHFGIGDQHHSGDGDQYHYGEGISQHYGTGDQLS